jgi:hypothetical protein
MGFELNSFSVQYQVCDDEWHHYAINVNFPEVELIVDGDKWIDERDNPEIIDDWPLHPAADITTKITIGACWQGQFKRNLLQKFLFRSMWKRHF